MIRSLPLAVLTRQRLRLGEQQQARQKPHNGALKLTALSSPRRKRLGYVKVMGALSPY
jgi:hypothetical protein